MRQIFLEQVQETETRTVYIVLRLVNSTDPKVGKKLSEDYVKGLCDDADWKVDIK